MLLVWVGCDCYSFGCLVCCGLFCLRGVRDVAVSCAFGGLCV